jgi:glyoxylase-like metal-dependent hydrolase (beta-lactamase superfamily II)
VKQIRWIRAHNPSPMTLDGTRTYMVGTARVAIIDPGPLLPAHLQAVAEATGVAAKSVILITHAHPDHNEGARALAARLRAEIVYARNGTTIDTDAGELLALATPGHTPDHMAYFLEGERAVFCGDLMTGGMDTALVAPPEGDLADYLHSLERIRALNPAVIYPAHGPPFEDAQQTIDRYVQHRMERIEQVVVALGKGPRSAAALVDRVYGAQLGSELRRYAESAVEAYLAYLAAGGRVVLSNGKWSLV